MGKKMRNRPVRLDSWFSTTPNGKNEEEKDLSDIDDLADFEED
jgi:hypothetical protein